MNFADAMELLKEGKKVTRELWKDGLYFVSEGEIVKAHQPHIGHYIYNESIMISDGWLVEGKEGPFKFCDIIPFLSQGLRARMCAWNTCFIYLDRPTQQLMLYSMEIFNYAPTFDAFLANDWIEVTDITAWENRND